VIKLTVSILFYIFCVNFSTKLFYTQKRYYVMLTSIYFSINFLFMNTTYKVM